MITSKEVRKLASLISTSSELVEAKLSPQTFSELEAL